MKKLASLFNPYNLYILATFVVYFPSVQADLTSQPSILVGAVHLYVSDIAFLVLLAYAFAKAIQPSRHRAAGSKRKNMGWGIRFIFGLFFLFSCIKWLMQGTFDTANIRMMLAYTPAFAFLFFFPMHMTRKEDIRNQFYLLIAFLAYIFVLHLYAFATEGFQIHILGGEFLSMLAMLYFFAIRKNQILKLAPLTSLVVKGLVIATYFMVGHRSGFIALLLGLMTYWMFYRKAAAKEILALVVIAAVGAGVALTVASRTFTGLENRASTTFDVNQDTYVGRYENMFLVLDVSKEHPWIGKPLVTNETFQWKQIDVTRGGVNSTVRMLVVTPHNLLLEWLMYYGWLGVLLGVSLIIAAVRYVKRFFREHSTNVQCRQLGVILLCVMVHNFFYALTNVTASNVFTTYFLYLPLVVLVAIGRNEANYCD